MPFLVDFRWLNEACAFLAGGHDPTVQTPCILENSTRGDWAHGNDGSDYHSLITKNGHIESRQFSKDFRLSLKAN